MSDNQDSATHFAKKPAVYVHQRFYARMAELNSTKPDAVKAMLIMMSYASMGGVVNVIQDDMAARCRMKIKEFKKAITDLGHEGVIFNVEFSAEKTGPLTFMVNSGYVYTEY